MCSVTLRVVGQGEKADARGPGPGAEHGDPVRVSTEGGDVLLDPAQGLDLVQQAVVPLGRLVPGAQEPWRHNPPGGLSQWESRQA